MLTDREMIEERCAQEMLTIKEWRTTEDGDTAVLGPYVVTSDDYEDDGLYPDDEGELTACVVGAEKYHNRRVAFSFLPEEFDCGIEIRHLSAIEPSDGF